METTGTRSVNQRQNMTAEKLAVQRVMNRDRQRILRQNMPEEQRSTVSERDRIRHRAAKEKLNLLSSIFTGNNVAHLFERVTQHVQTEVQGYMELGPQYLGYTRKIQNYGMNRKAPTDAI
ncbi:hypothetical protein MKW92_038205 [Papaver armeniacum]|nr:hypothetical protein MKW92_038205 [Papaver armeniacum]